MDANVTQFFPLILSAIAGTYCAIAGYMWRALRGRYWFTAVICILYSAASIRWFLLDVWGVVDMEFTCERFIWDVLESLIFIALLYMAKMPADIGFRRPQ